MVASEHLDVVEGVRRLISTDVLGPEEESEDSSIDYEVDALDEQDGGGLVEADVLTGVTEVGTKEV